VIAGGVLRHAARRSASNIDKEISCSTDSPGVDHAAMGHGAAVPAPAVDHAAMGHAPSETAASTVTAAPMDHGAGGMSDMSLAPQVKDGPGVQTISPMPADRTAEPPVGLEGLGHRPLTYRDLVATVRNPDVRAPTRSMDIHLTGNMGAAITHSMEHMMF